MTTEFQVKIGHGANEILTVSQLNKAVSRLFDENLAPGWVRGEISNFTAATSGHWYFTLKDEAASVRAVMFRGRALTTGFLPRPGDSVEVRARVTLYEARGEYQIQVDQMRRSGLGSLYEAFLALGVFGVLYWFRTRKRFDGQLILMYFCLLTRSIAYSGTKKMLYQYFTPEDTSRLSMRC